MGMTWTEEKRKKILTVGELRKAGDTMEVIATKMGFNKSTAAALAHQFLCYEAGLAMLAEEPTSLEGLALTGRPAVSPSVQAHLRFHDGITSLKELAASGLTAGDLLAAPSMGPKGLKHLIIVMAGFELALGEDQKGARIYAALAAEKERKARFFEMVADRMKDFPSGTTMREALSEEEVQKIWIASATKPGSA